MKKTISVEQKHIDEGLPGLQGRCPIALAGNGFTCHDGASKELPDWWVKPAPVKLKEKVIA